MRMREGGCGFGALELRVALLSGRCLGHCPDGPHRQAKGENCLSELGVGVDNDSEMALFWNITSRGNT